MNKLSQQTAAQIQTLATEIQLLGGMNNLWNTLEEGEIEVKFNTLVDLVDDQEAHAEACTKAAWFLPGFIY